MSLRELKTSIRDAIPHFEGIKLRRKKSRPLLHQNNNNHNSLAEGTRQRSFGSIFSFADSLKANVVQRTGSVRVTRQERRTTVRAQDIFFGDLAHPHPHPHHPEDGTQQGDFERRRRLEEEDEQQQQAARTTIPSPSPHHDDDDNDEGRAATPMTPAVLTKALVLPISGGSDKDEKEVVGEEEGSELVERRSRHCSLRRSHSSPRPISSPRSDSDDLSVPEFEGYLDILSYLQREHHLHQQQPTVVAQGTARAHARTPPSPPLLVVPPPPPIGTILQTPREEEWLSSSRSCRSASQSSLSNASRRSRSVVWGSSGSGSGSGGSGSGLLSRTNSSTTKTVTPMSSVDSDSELRLYGGYGHGHGGKQQQQQQQQQQALGLSTNALAARAESCIEEEGSESETAAAATAMTEASVSPSPPKMTPTRRSFATTTTTTGTGGATTPSMKCFHCGRAPWGPDPAFTNSSFVTVLNALEQDERRRHSGILLARELEEELEEEKDELPVENKATGPSIPVADAQGHRYLLYPQTSFYEAVEDSDSGKDSSEGQEDGILDNDNDDDDDDDDDGGGGDDGDDDDEEFESDSDIVHPRSSCQVVLENARRDIIYALGEAHHGTEFWDDDDEEDEEDANSCTPTAPVADPYERPFNPDPYTPLDSPSFSEYSDEQFHPIQDDDDHYNHYDYYDDGEEEEGGGGDEYHPTLPCRSERGQTPQSRRPHPCPTFWKDPDGVIVVYKGIEVNGTQVFYGADINYLGSFYDEEEDSSGLGSAHHSPTDSVATMMMMPPPPPTTAGLCMIPETSFLEEEDEEEEGELSYGEVFG